VHRAKVLFERYFLYKVRHGRPEPMYEKLALQAMGIGKLKMRPTRSKTPEKIGA
jgi:sulfide:quinone oxidoreductase